MSAQLMGISEIAERLGVSKSRVSQLLRAGELPEPKQRLAMGPVWHASVIERWASKREAA